MGTLCVSLLLPLVIFCFVNCSSAQDRLFLSDFLSWINTAIDTLERSRIARGSHGGGGKYDDDTRTADFLKSSIYINVGILGANFFAP